jgi:threonyl-tRNA synthetase
MSYHFDHRFLAREMELYFFDEMVGAGLPMWLPNGAIIREELERFIKAKEFREGFMRVSCPHIARAELYKMSGHLKFYKDDMFPEMKPEFDHSSFYLRPMNCPHHHKVFDSKIRSYRELPLRLAEYGQVYRFEASGALKGLSRVRGLCQNDGHIYIDPKFAKDEILKVLKLNEECYQEIGLSGHRYRLSKHDPECPSEFEGDKDLWILAENILRECLMEMKLDYYEASGEAAFYGPKIDIQMKFFNENKLHEESVSSIQIDFLSGERFGLSFLNENQEKICPWIIHRAPLGSHERFIAMLLEYYDGLLPFWLSPIQFYLFPVGDHALKFSESLKLKLRENGIRVEVDIRQVSLSKRLALGRKLRPYSFAIIGERELDLKKIEIQFRDSLKQVEIEKMSEFFRSLKS